MRNWKLVVEYDGSAFEGWQIQPGRPTVQGTLAAAIGKMTGEDVVLHGAGRTDAGVHAEGQVANFRTASRLGARNYLYGLNSLTPPTLAVRSVEEVDESFHASRSSRGKVYRYEVRVSEAPSALEAGRVWWVRRALDGGAMRDAARRFLGRRDFRSLEGANSPRRTTVRDLFLVDVEERPSRFSFRVGGGGFLYKMVRNLVGTLVEVGTGRRSPDSIEALLEARDRRAGGATAPAHGLVLERVIY